MSLWQSIMQRVRRRSPPVVPGRVSSAGMVNNSLSPYRSRTADALSELRKIREQADAIDFLRKVNPDVSMAVWNFVRLANQGHEMHFYDGDNRNMELEGQWRDFSARVNQLSNAGMDGLIDILHQSAFMRGAQCLEVEVSPDRKDIVDVHPIIPQTLTWELEERNGRKVWIPYQQAWMKKVSLEPGKANFFHVPTDADIDDPRGNLLMSPVLQAIDFQMQILQDLQMVIHRQGWPRNDVEISRESVIQMMPASVKANPAKAQKWFEDVYNNVITALGNLHPDSDYVHFDDTKITMTGGANANRSLDVRAVMELVDVQALSGAKQMGVFMNRMHGTTETLSTVQFRIFTTGIQSIQRGSKRLIEEVARMWLRVNGVQSIPHFEHNTIDWRAEEDVAKVNLMKQEFWAIAQLMQWVSGDMAAQEVMDVESAAGEPDPERIRVSFSVGGGTGGDSDKHSSIENGRDGKVSYLRKVGKGN